MGNSNAKSHLLSVSTFKTCTSCKCIKPANKEFWVKSARGLWGLTSTCKICRRLSSKQWRLANVERVCEYDKTYHQNNKTKKNKRSKQRYWNNREASLAAFKVWYESNKEHDNIRSLEWRNANIDHCRQSARDYLKNNPGKRKMHDRLRRARKQGAESEPYGNVELNAIWYSQNGCCYYCDALLFGNYQIEHKTPLARGGTDKLDNICLSCPLCNHSKGRKTEEEFKRFLSK